MSNQFTFYGFPEECHKFEQRHPTWSESRKNLEKAVNLAFTRVQTMTGPADKLVYFLGRVVAEDFFEVELVCCHGYGVAASKLVRSMYEYAVTLRYLHEHADEAGTFLAYHKVQQERLLSRLIETFGENVLSGEQVAKVRREAPDVREDFMVPVCGHPGAQMRLNHSWNKLDFVAMAKKVGSLGKLIVPGYYMPLRHAHPTFGGLSERLEGVNGSIGMTTDAQPEIADRSLTTAHYCVLDALQVQNEHFKIDGLEDAIQVCYQDFMRAWASESSSPVDKAP
jgi:Family of unknown function (DUF5677)